ncbi:MAG: DUF126 domain-containing protein [Cytophagaceae bacterium]|nr:DUF126 domain-containing protein [Gemmatimonadaceae bacterium]
MMQARDVLVAGEARGPVVALSEPLSFWGGVHEREGTVIDVHHPQHGVSIAGRVLVMPSGRGSSSSSSVLAEVIRAGVGPAAIVLATADPILVIGALVAEALYGTVVPIVVLSPDDYARCASARELEVLPSGRVNLAQ